MKIPNVNCTKFQTIKLEMENIKKLLYKQKNNSPVKWKSDIFISFIFINWIL